MPGSPALSQILRRALLPALLVLAATTACSRLRRGDDVDDADQRAVMVFVNESLYQADVFAVAQSSESVRIGTVLPGGTESLSVPAHLVGTGQVNIVARLLASSRAPSSGPIPLSPGSRYKVTLSIDGRLLSVLPANP